MGRAPPDAAAALRVLERTYRSLNAPLLARVDALVSRHLAATRPEVVTATFANGVKRTYRREIETRQDAVGLRQARRRRTQATKAVSKIMRIDAGLASAVLDDVCRRARSRGGVAIAPTAAIHSLPIRLQTQFTVDNSAATFQRFRLFLGPQSGLASPLALREDLGKAAAEERNRATSNGDGAYLVSPRAALEAAIWDLRSR